MSVRILDSNCDIGSPRFHDLFGDGKQMFWMTMRRLAECITRQSDSKQIRNLYYPLMALGNNVAIHAKPFMLAAPG